MFGLLLLVLIGGVIVAVWTQERRHRTRHGVDLMPPYSSERPDAAPGGAGAPVVAATNARLADSLAQWEAAGLITAEQAAGIRAFEQAATLQAEGFAAPRARRVPVVAEALGYLGGILGLVGLVLLITKYWPDMATPARLALAGGAAAVLTIGGFMVPDAGEPAFERLRWFLWLGATAAGGLAAGVTAVDVFDADDPAVVALAVAGTVTVHSALLWWQKERPVQQVTCLGGLMVTVATATALVASDGPVGLALWVTGLLMLTAGVFHLTPMAWITGGIGAGGALVGAAAMCSDWQSLGLLVLLLTASGLLALAATTKPVATDSEQIVLTVVGSIGMANAIPGNIGYWGEQAGILTGAVLWCAGAALLLLAGRSFVRTPTLVRIAGGAALVGGAAVMGLQSVAVATVFGLLTAVGLIVLGTYPEHVLMSLFGSLGLLVNVPWAIRYFFPGEGRVPLLILVSGVLIVGVAVWLSRMGGQIRHQFHFHHH